MRPRYDVFLRPPVYDDGMDHDYIDKLAQCIVKAWRGAASSRTHCQMMPSLPDHLAAGTIGQSRHLDAATKQTKAERRTPDMTLQELSDAVRPLGLATLTRTIWHAAAYMETV